MGLMMGSLWLSNAWCATAGWSPATDKAATIWECVQHTIRVLNAEDGGAEAAADTSGFDRACDSGVA